MSSSYRFYWSKIFFPKWDKYHIFQDHKIFFSFGVYPKCVYHVGIMFNPRLGTRGAWAQIKLIKFEIGFSFGLRYLEDVPKKPKPKEYEWQ